MSAENQALQLEQQILCTCVGASLTSLCTTPLDVVKVRLQADQRQTKKPTIIPNHRLHMVLCDCKRLFSSVPTRFEHTCTNTCFKGNLRFMLNSHNEVSSNIFKASLDVSKRIARKEGFGSLWSGLAPALVMSVPGTMIYYTAYDRLKAQLGYDHPDPSKLYIPALAGTISRVAAVTVVSPIELLRTKMQSARLSYTQTYQCIRASIHLYGPSVLFRGLAPSLLRDVPFSAIYWVSYEGIKAEYAHKHLHQTPPHAITFLAGALSGTVAALITCPFDVVKTHRQIELGEERPLKSVSRKATNLHTTTARTSTLSLINLLYHTKGVKALFAGIVPRLVKVAPACAIMITSYEMGKNYFRNMNAML